MRILIFITSIIMFVFVVQGRNQDSFVDDIVGSAVPISNNHYVAAESDMIDINDKDICDPESKIDCNKDQCIDECIETFKNNEVSGECVPEKGCICKVGLCDYRKKAVGVEVGKKRISTIVEYGYNAPAR